MLKYEVLYDEYKNEDLARVLLTDEKWNGIIYHYQTVKFLDGDEDDAVMQFEYDVVEAPPDFNVETLTPEDQKEFETMLGDILIEIIREALESENRTNDTEQPDL